MTEELIHRTLSKHSINESVSLLLEMSAVAGEVFHFTHPGYALAIIQTNELRLGLLSNMDSVPSQPLTDYYYLSTTRQFSNQFGKAYNVRLNLDGNKLRSQLKVQPFDYWSRNTAMSKKDPAFFEAEDRFFYNKPVLKNFRRFLLSVDIYLTPHENKERQLCLELAETCAERSIPVTIYSTSKDFRFRRNGKPWNPDEHEKPERDVPAVWRKGQPLSPTQFGDLIFLLRSIGLTKQRIASVFYRNAQNVLLFTTLNDQQIEDYFRWIDAELDTTLEDIDQQIKTFVNLPFKTQRDRLNDLLITIRTTRVYRETLSAALESEFAKELRKNKVYSTEVVDFVHAKMNPE